MLDIFYRLLDIVIPPHSSVLQLRTETQETFVRFFSPRVVNNCFVLSEYKEPTIRLAINANKFHNDYHSAKLLASLFNKWLISLPDKPTILVPIPLSKEREKDRGYNQVARILDRLIVSENTKIKNILTRYINTSPQTQKDRKHRLAEMNNVFRYRPQNLKLNDYRIILVDDVITTGATISSAYKVLRKNLPSDTEILCLALAH